MNWPLSYREGQFSPVEAAACTGLSLTLQRDWRSLGHLPPRISGHARFTPRELAEMRTMVVLRRLGLGLAECRAAAMRAAPSILFLALADNERCLSVDAEPDRARRFLDALGYAHDERHLRTLSGAGQLRYLFILLEDEDCKLLPDLSAESLDNKTEGVTIAKLEVIAAKLVAAAPHPLFTVTVPPEFE